MMKSSEFHIAKPSEGLDNFPELEFPMNDLSVLCVSFS